MDIDSVTVRQIAAPLKEPFVTHLETVTKREALIIEIRDREGCCGYGESDPFSSPWYSPETIVSCRSALENWLIPQLMEQPINSPEDLDRYFPMIRGNRMAKSGLSQAVWDLFARKRNVPLRKLVGGRRQKIAAGAVIAAADPGQALEQIARFSEAGYQRYKIKISKENDHQLLGTIRSCYPQLPLMADANSSYSLADCAHLKTLDHYQLMMIEQPLAWNDLADHAVLRQQIRTPICLDESICSVSDMKAALHLGSCQAAAIKMARLGGWSATLKILQLCDSARMAVWCGGMIEFGIAKAHDLALASRAEFVLPGDLFSSARYWAEDIIEPEIVINDGFISIPDGPGIGFSINHRALDRLTQSRRTFRRKTLI